MMPSPGNEHATEAPGAALPGGKVEPAPGESPRPKRAYVKPVLKRYGVLKSVAGSKIDFTPPE
jgi:hypothetical protein